MLKTRVPVKDAHVRQFVMARYGNNTNVIGLNRKTMLGSLVELACERVGYRHVLPKVDTDDSICITLLYPDSMKNHFVHPNKLATLAKMMAYLFQQTFLEAIEVSQYLGISDYEAVNAFMERYGITEDMVAADTLRKKWRDHQRYMARKIDARLQTS